jgi:ribonuclease HI
MNDGLTCGPASTSSTTNCLPIGSDSTWAGSNSGRKLIGGYIFLYEGSPISWQSKRQACVATSSNEAEYMAISEASKEALWPRRVCIEMHVATPESPPILLHTDSEGAQALASTEGTKRSKHIDVRYHHIRELQSLALVSVEGIRSQDNPADGLTKIQSTPRHRHFLHLINMDRNHLHPTSDGK